MWYTSRSVSTCHVFVPRYNDILLLHSPPHLQILILIWLDPSRFIRVASSLKWLHPLTSIRWFTRWTESIPLTNSRAENTAQALLLVVRFHIFVSHQEWQLIIENTLNLLSGDTSWNFWNLTAYELKPTRLTHQTFHHRLKAALKSDPHPNLWADSFSMVLLGIQTALKQDVGCSRNEFVYGGNTLHLLRPLISSSTKQTLYSTGPLWLNVCHLTQVIHAAITSYTY